MVIFGNAETILIRFLKIYTYFLISHIGTYVLQVIRVIYKFYLWLGATPVNIFIFGIQTFTNFHKFDSLRMHFLYISGMREAVLRSSLKPILRKCTFVTLWWMCVSCCLSATLWRMLLLTSFWTMRHCTDFEPLHHAWIHFLMMFFLSILQIPEVWTNFLLAVCEQRVIFLTNFSYSWISENPAIYIPQNCCLNIFPPSPLLPNFPVCLIGFYLLGALFGFCLSVCFYLVG